MRRAVLRVLLALILVLVAGGFWLMWPELSSSSAPAAATAPVSAETVARGRYLARAGNCLACHTEPGRSAYAGGRRIPTPFGDLFSTNLTPDAETGLGRWSADDFWRALHEGRSRDGRLLYPAFPYPDYTRVTRADADAMYAYFRSLTAVRSPPVAAELRFPYNTQLALRVWRRLYFRPGAFQPRPERSLAWNRGAYLVEGLGHCNACHGRRNWLGGVRDDARFAGGPIPMLGWDAPPLTRPRPMSDAEAVELAELLQGGTSSRNVTTGPMAEVVFHSLQHLQTADIAAIVSYLRSLPAVAAPPVTDERMPERRRRALSARGAAVYEKHCDECHGPAGEGRPYVYPALAGSTLVTASSPSNAIQTLLYGGFGPSTAAQPRPYGMPPYAHQLPPEDLAAVLTYIRSAWGNAAPAVSAAEVSRH